jgi:hypothetical protein
LAISLDIPLALERVGCEAGNLGMRANLADVFLLNVINGSSIAVLTLNDVKDIVAITLGLVTIFSTLLIIRDNFRKRREKHRSDTEGTEARTTERAEKRAQFRPKLRLFAVLIGISVFGTGCAQLDGLYDRQVTEIPGEVLRRSTILRTNEVVLEAASTNTAGLIVPAKIAQVVTPEIAVPYAPPTYITNLVPRLGVETGIKAVAAAPVPWAGTAALGLGWLYSAYASLRNKQVAKALVQSVQVGREFLQRTPEGEKLDAELKRLLQRHQEYAGVAREVKKILDTCVPKHLDHTSNPECEVPSSKKGACHSIAF